MGTDRPGEAEVFNRPTGSNVNGISDCGHQDRAGPFGDPANDDESDRGGDRPQERCGGIERGTTSQEEGVGGELLHGVRTHSMRVAEGGNEEAAVRPVSKAVARYVQKEADNIASEAFTYLTNHGPTVLIEVACSPENRLSQEIQKQAGYEAAAIRCSHWNGCDLSTDSGVRLTLDTIQQHRPRHVWISTECGPFSPMQAINQRSANQVADLETKRKAALRQYIGGSCVYHYCIQLGIHVMGMG